MAHMYNFLAVTLIASKLTFSMVFNSLVDGTVNHLPLAGNRFTAVVHGSEESDCPIGTIERTEVENERRSIKNSELIPVTDASRDKRSGLPFELHSGFRHGKNQVVYESVATRKEHEVNVV